MIIKNFFDSQGVKRSIHNGKGLAKSVKIFGENDFETNLKYVSFTSLPPGTSIGFHDHNDKREKVYTILNETGIFTLNKEEKKVKSGDVILTKPGFSHGLKNNSSEALDVFIFWVKK